jgi:hypothetical protein
VCWCIPVTGTPAVMSLLTPWDLHSVTSGCWADPDADIVLVVRRHFLELSKRSILVSGGGDRRGISVRRGCELVGSRCVGNAVTSATESPQREWTHPSGVGMAVPGACALATPALDIM